MILHNRCITIVFVVFCLLRDKRKLLRTQKAFKNAVQSAMLVKLLEQYFLDSKGVESRGACQTSSRPVRAFEQFSASLDLSVESGARNRAGCACVVLTAEKAVARNYR